MERIFDIKKIDEEFIIKIFNKFDDKISIKSVSLIHSGMSTTNYKVITTVRTYLLKVFGNGKSHIEIAMYKYLKDKISIPKMYFFDDTLDTYECPYAIIEFIDGITLSEYIRINKDYPLEFSYEIGRILSIIHQKTFNNKGYLSNELVLIKNEKNTRDFIIDMLSDKAGQYFDVDFKNKIFTFIQHNNSLLDMIDKEAVLVHGDLNYNNILIHGQKVYFIDFEYAMGESKYLDIGKFFRLKERDIQEHIKEENIKSFYNGYNNLPKEWFILCKIKDIASMLGFINRDNIKSIWIEEIKEEIMYNISLLNNE